MMQRTFVEKQRENGPKQRIRRRQGNAPIEFVLFVPIYAIFLLVFIWITKVRLTEMYVGHEAATMSLVDIAQSDASNTVPRGGNWSELRSAPSLRKLVDGFQRGLPLTSGGVQSTSEHDTGDGVPLAINPIGTVHDRNELLSHSWENRVYAFPRGESEQSQLTLPPQVRGIASGMSDLSAFTRLRNFSGGSLSGSLGSLARLGARSIRAVSQMQEAIRTLENSIEELTLQIDTLRSEEFPDWGRIQLLENQRHSLQGDLSKLRNGQDHLQDALSIKDRLELPVVNSQD